MLHVKLASRSWSNDFQEIPRERKNSNGNSFKSLTSMQRSLHTHTHFNTLAFEHENTHRFNFFNVWIAIDYVAFAVPLRIHDIHGTKEKRKTLMEFIARFTIEKMNFTML